MIERIFVESYIESIQNREDACWMMSKVFLENKDAHGLHDMGVEIQALQRAKSELEKLLETEVHTIFYECGDTNS
jgi:hypothetical protein